MNIQSQVANVIAQSMSTLGGEQITIGSTELTAVIDQENRSRDLMGGSRIGRELNVEFPTDKTLSLNVGMIVHARGKEWKIDEPLRKGQSMTNLILIEPNRITE